MSEMLDEVLVMQKKRAQQAVEFLDNELSTIREMLYMCLSASHDCPGFQASQHLRDALDQVSALKFKLIQQRRSK